jgi:hypothetical protein
LEPVTQRAAAGAEPEAEEAAELELERDEDEEELGAPALEDELEEEKSA